MQVVFRCIEIGQMATFATVKRHGSSFDDAPPSLTGGPVRLLSAKSRRPWPSALR